MAHSIIHVFSLLVVTLLAVLQGSHAVEYVVTNNALNTRGGIRFRDEIGAEYAKQTLISASDFIWRTFQQNSAADRKNVQKISLIIEDINGVAFTSNNEIHVSAKYVGSYSGDVKREITGVLYHELTHVWQWNGKGQTPGGLIEGIADFVRLKAGYAPSHWVKAGEGTKWDQGYDVTAWFLDYLNGLKNGFVAQLNKKTRDGYSANYFVELLGKTVDQLWNDYTAKFGK
ncbi:Basic secretory protein [Quillaja saponaria]|uniref:Basic secretory protein n=1 Tax=Quillaja saponaria TaxID=32244 RepID=A0AAD7KU66_QUISA|nr:Basic secretory protein [Quillaja saponaria]